MLSHESAIFIHILQHSIVRSENDVAEIWNLVYLSDVRVGKWLKSMSIIVLMRSTNWICDLRDNLSETNKRVTYERVFAFDNGFVM